jgi:uncharacterized membrane protein YcaP (DUF421 family)
MSVDWSELFGLSVPPLELLVRGTAMYLFLFALFRFVIKRRVGSIGMADILVLVIVGTILAWNYFFDWANYRFAWMQRWLEPDPLLLIRDGRVLWRHMRLERVTEKELTAKLREHGVTEVAEVAKAYMEPDGQVTVIKRSASDASRS